MIEEKYQAILALYEDKIQITKFKRGQKQYHLNVSDTKLNTIFLMTLHKYFGIMSNEILVTK